MADVKCWSEVPGKQTNVGSLICYYTISLIRSLPALQEQIWVWGSLRPITVSLRKTIQNKQKITQYNIIKKTTGTKLIFMCIIKNQDKLFLKA